MKLQHCSAISTKLNYCTALSLNSLEMYTVINNQRYANLRVRQNIKEYSSERGCGTGVNAIPNG